MEKVSFGRRNVTPEEKQRLVGDVFRSVASDYDVMNDLMSVGVHRIWKSVLLDRLNPQPGQVLLDVAGGTGDVALGFLGRAAARPERGRSPAQAIACDINHAMLSAGQTRPDAAAFGENFRQVCGSAEALPMPDNSVDRYTIAFGIRNVSHRDKALAEARRVLRPGGQFVCLEFSRPITPGIEAVYNAYSDAVIPALGEAVADDRASYEYLVESIRKFPPQDAFLQEVKEAGFARAKVENLSAGIAALHSGWKV